MSDVSGFAQAGFLVEKNLLPPDLLSALLRQIEDRREAPARGLRQADKKLPACAQLATHPALLQKAQALLGAPVCVVRVILFDKTAQNNWLVSWHQDKTIALDRRVERAGWGPWSVKDGVHHVQPGLDVLEQMLSFRVHLDDADEDNGCLRVIPGSHRYGLLSAEAIQRLKALHTAHACCVQAGDVVVMRPHLLHASSKSRRAGHRRVVHIEYSAYDLPAGLRWAAC